MTAAAGYVPVYVLEHFSPEEPPPPNSDIALFAAPFDPPAPLSIGTKVALNLITSPPPLLIHARSVYEVYALPLAVAGSIVGVRTQRRDTVVYVVKNDIRSSPLRTVHLYLRGTPATPAPVLDARDLQRRLEALNPDRAVANTRGRPRLPRPGATVDWAPAPPSRPLDSLPPVPEHYETTITDLLPSTDNECTPGVAEAMADWVRMARNGQVDGCSAEFDDDDGDTASVMSCSSDSTVVASCTSVAEL
ncbi:hypothetical protein OH77DRAFT_446646 [Trametes cingulata]|nr:hypothetical protein OH77DRAFT_446646 [Trametes cingulata]